MKLDIQVSKRRKSHQKSLGAPSPNSNTLADRLAELHSEHGSIGPLLFGIKYHQEIIDCLDTPTTLAKLSNVGDGYGTDISKGLRFAKYVIYRA